MGQPIVHWEVGGKDGKKLQEFYSKLFDWKIDANNPMNYGMVNTGTDKGIAGGINPTDGQMPNYVTVYAQVDNLEASLVKAESLGGKRLVPPTDIPEGGAFALFQDPEGNCFGLYKE